MFLLLLRTEVFCYKVAALFHEPFRRAGGSAYTDGIYSIKPFEIYFCRTLYLIAIRVHAPAFIEQNFAIAAFPATHEENEVMLLRKVGNIGHSVGNLSTDSVETLECGVR